MVDRLKAKRDGLLAESIETLTDISARADAMRLGLVAYPVADVRRVLEALRQEAPHG